EGSGRLRLTGSAQTNPFPNGFIQAQRQVIRPMQRLVYANRVWLLLAIHAVLFAIAYWTATQLRFDFDVPPETNRIFLETIWVVVGLQVACAWLFGSLHGWMRYVTFHDLVAILRSTFAGIVAVVVADYWFFKRLEIPRAIVMMDLLLAVLL